MKRLRLLLALIVSLTVSVVGVIATPASADAHVPFNVAAGRGTVSGTVVFHNRSVTISGGRVKDYCSSQGGYTQARFQFYLDTAGTIELVGPPETRTAQYCEEKTFGWTEEGPRGGIRRVDVSVCTVYASSCAWYPVYKPGV